MAETDFSPLEEEPKYTAERKDGEVDHESFTIIQEIGEDLPLKEGHSTYHNISFAKEHQHLGLIASVIADYIETNPTKQENSINVSGKTLEILATLGIPYEICPPEPLSTSQSPDNVIFLHTKKSSD